MKKKIPHIVKLRSKLGIVGCVAVLMLTYMNCAKSNGLVPLTELDLSSAAVQDVIVNFCEPPPVSQSTNIKTLIILDHSGSNAQNYKMKSDGSGEPDVSTGTVVISNSYATDPKGLLRYGTPTATGSLLNYLSLLPANSPTDPKRFFALVDFSDNAASYPPGGNSFTSNLTDFYNHVYADAGTASGGAPNDSGATSYITSLNMAYNIINTDVQASKACAAKPKTAAATTACPHPGTSTAVSYVVLFMSDGSPIIKVGLGSLNGNVVETPITTADCPAPAQLIDGLICKESQQSILGLVGSIAALSTDQLDVASVNFFTVYYYVPGNIDTNSQSLLARMASIGNGLSYNALSGSSLDYNQFQPPQKQVQYSLSDVFVSNASGVWWSDGKFHADTDGDGLPDDVELAWGSSPTDPRTGGNGVSDLVRYRLANGAACTTKNSSGICTDAVTDYASGLCSGVSHVTDPTHAGGILFNSTDPAGLNDCEKIVLNDQGGINNPDSNTDSIPDFLEFKNNVPFQKGTAPAVTSPTLDGYSLYAKIKYNLPTQSSLLDSPNLTPANYNLQLTSSSNLQNCYRLDVTNLPMATAADKIRVDLTFKTNLTNVSEQYRTATKQFSGSSQSLIFNDWNDPTEITNQTWKSWP